MTPRMPDKRALKRLGLRAARTAPFARLVGLLERLDRSKRPVLPVLLYHRVDHADRSPDLDPSVISATPADFEEQMRFLAARRRPLSMEELIEIRAGRAALPPRAVLVTFDDAYRDFQEHAWPALRRHGVPVALFVPTSYPDDPGRSFWWDRLHAVIMGAKARDPVATPAGVLELATAQDREIGFRRMLEWVGENDHDTAMAAIERLASEVGNGASAGQVLGWDELRQLAAEGVHLGAHTRTHPMLNRVPLERAKDEVLGSVDDLRRQVGCQPQAFAFPRGAMTPELVTWLPQAGVEVAFTTARGRNHIPGADWLCLKRIVVGHRSGLSAIRAQLLSWPQGGRG
jgi:peptidoglycan/xylan/chitin deacetylase (PgdA/CDA1 family)